MKPLKKLLSAVLAGVLFLSWSVLGSAPKAWSYVEESNYHYESMTPRHQYVFSSLSDVEVDVAGSVYVSEWSSPDIRIFDEGGNERTPWTFDADQSSFKLAKGADNMLYAASQDKVWKLDMSKQGADAIAHMWNGTEQFYYIDDLVYNKVTGTAAGVDSYDDSIWLFDEEFGSIHVEQYWDQAEALQSFGDIMAIAADLEGNWIVAENGDEIVILDSDWHELRRIHPTFDWELEYEVWIDSLAAQDDGSLYIGDSSNNMLAKWEDGAIVAEIGGYGNDADQFDGLRGISLSSGGEIYAADSYNNRIQKFDGDLQPLASWGSEGGEEGRFYIPENVSVGPDGTVYVADQGNERIQAFNPKLQFMDAMGQEGFSPYGIAVRADGQVFITSDSSLLRYNPITQLVEGIDSGLGNPYDLSFDSDGNLYVANTSGYRIEKYELDEEDNYHKIDRSEQDENWFIGEPDYDGGYFYFHPRSLAVDSERGIVYASDTMHIQTFSLDGELLDADWFGYPEGSGNFITDVALDVAGNVYFSNYNTNLVTKLDPSGAYITSWGGTGFEPGRFGQIEKLTVDGDGNVYVTDDGYSRLVKFAFDGNRLTALSLTGAALQEQFSADQISYTAEMDAETDSFTITPEAFDDAAEVLVDGSETISGSPSIHIQVAAGETKQVDIEVTAADGQSRIYMLIVHRTEAAAGGEDEGGNGDGDNGDGSGDNGGNGDGNGDNGGTGGNGNDNGGNSGNETDNGADSDNTGGESSSGEEEQPISSSGSVMAELSNDGGAPIAIVDESKLEQALDKIIAEGHSRRESVLITIPEVEIGTASKARIPAAMLEKARSNGISIELKYENVSVTIPAGAISSSDLQQAAYIDFSQSIADQAFTGRVLQQVADKSMGYSPVPVLYQFELELTDDSGASQLIRRFNKPLTIAISVDEEMQASIQDKRKTGVYYVAAGGAVTFMGGKWMDGKLAFQTHHFSDYAIMQYDKFFSDVVDGWSKPYIELLASRHIASGTGESSFSPQEIVTRAQFAAFLGRALELADGEGGEVGVPYPDVSGDAYYANYVSELSRIGIIQGYDDGSFKPDAIITREQLVVMMMRAYEYAAGESVDPGNGAAGFTDLEQAAGYAVNSIRAAAKLGLINGNGEGSFAPLAPATREQAAKLLIELLEKAEWL